jgi:hypothetical protein
MSGPGGGAAGGAGVGWPGCGGWTGLGVAGGWPGTGGSSGVGVSCMKMLLSCSTRSQDASF